jgi:hypothetical protein
LIAECFSNTLCLEKSSASVPADVLASAVARDIATDIITDDQRMVNDNEAAANDVDMDEHLPVGDNSESEDEDDFLTEEKEVATEEEQRPVGLLNMLEPVDEEPTTFADRKEATKSYLERR